MSIDNYQSRRDAGLDFLEKGELRNAISCFESYVSEVPQDLATTILIADTYRELNELDEANRYYLQALSINPIDTQLLLKYSATNLVAMDYKKVLKKQHLKLKPKRYIEIGVCKGASFKLASEKTVSLGIDPEPQLSLESLPKNHTVVSETSDEYFKSGKIKKDFNGEPLDMAFLDGMHIFEYVLRDFINIEKYTHSNSVVFVHDLFPLNAVTASRKRTSDFWSGDVWKLVLCLKEYRPELQLEILPCPPTGLGVITNLDAHSCILTDHYDEILAKYINMPFNVIERDREKKLLLADITSSWLR